MGNYKDLYPSKYLTAADVMAAGGHMDVTIESVAQEAVGREREMKPVVALRGERKGLVLIKTNATTIAELTGSEDPQDWPGHRVRLIVVKVESGGKRVDGIRIEPVPTPRKKAARAAQPVEEEPPVPEAEPWLADDDFAEEPAR